MAKKKTNLQPWLDYFKMLQQYEAKGFLEIKPQEHEAYVTRAALLTLVPEDVSSFKFQVSRNDAQQEPETRNLKPEINDKALVALLNRLRAYAGWKAAAANSQLSTLNSQLNTPFATHIVKEDYPHDLLLTLLLQQKRSWRTTWRTVDTIEVIDYAEKMKNEK